jgi:hypothetical protein
MLNEYPNEIVSMLKGPTKPLPEHSVKGVRSGFSWWKRVRHPLNIQHDQFSRNWSSSILSSAPTDPTGDKNRRSQCGHQNH